MKKLIILIVLIAFNNTIAQVQKYHQVKITGDGSLTKKLLQLGITIDHSESSETEVIAEISESEVNKLKEHQIQHQILIYDMAKFYEMRNQASKSLAAGVCNAPPITKPTNFHLGSMGGYFTFVEMQQILDSMQLLYPNLITVKQALSPLSIEGRSIWQVRISDNPNTNENEPEVLYTSLHHAREAASLSQLIFYMWYLLENYSTDPEIKAIVDNSELYFVPCVNPDGYVYNQTTNPNGGGMWRKNRRNNLDGTFGVDLNRNYGSNWGYDNTGSSPNSSSDTYRGTAGFSEPETQAIRNFCNTHTFVTALNAHTYSNLLIYPYGYLPSFYTPDSATFVNWAVLLTEDTRFLYGTGDQTVNYVTNGDSDDWMYSEQTTKNKILSMTPEAGSASDGFWPASSRILDICKTTFSQNLYLAKLAIGMAVGRDNEDKFLASSGFINYNLQRLSINPGSFTVSIVPLGGSLSSVGAPKVYNSLTLNQTVSDSISYSISSSLAPGQALKYLIQVNSGAFLHQDTITKIVGTPITLFSNTGVNVAGSYTTSGTWGLSTTKFKSPPSSITDSPTSNYSSNTNKSITTNSNIPLTNAVYAHLQYYTRFEIEKNNDKAQVFISTNNGSSFVPLCGRYETSPASFGGTNPVYDGLQDGWVKEDIDLSAYLGQSIRIRFSLQSNFSNNKDGFYIDDMLIRIIDNTFVGVTKQFLDTDIVLFPNPSKDYIKINSERDLSSSEITITNSLGMLLYKVKPEGTSTQIETRELSPGVYFLHLTLNGKTMVKKFIKE
jgi:hypothetical protein